VAAATKTIAVLLQLSNGLYKCIYHGNEQTNSGSPRLYKQEWLIVTAVWNRRSSRAVRHGSSSGVVCASLRQMNQKKLLVHVM
jgi:hypothetical protein